MPRNEALGVHLLCEHVPAEGDAALQGDRGEVGALSAFRFRPGVHRRKNPSNRRAQEIQEAEIGVDRQWMLRDEARAEISFRLQQPVLAG